MPYLKPYPVIPTVRSFPPQAFPLKTHYPISLSLSLSKTMKGSHRRRTAPERYSNKRNGGFRRYYLKPGRLAQLRDSKIMASSQRHQLKTQISVFQSLVLPTTTPSSSSSSPSGNNMPNQSDGVPCFASKTSNHPRCPHRKKVVAVTPVFHEVSVQL